MSEQTTALTVMPEGGADIVRSALGVNDILAQVRLIQEVMAKVMSEGEHFGKIPGCGTKSTLLQPGAQKLTMTFRLAPEYQIQETSFAGMHKEYRVICTLKSIQSGSFVGQGVGCCSTMEGKYRYRGGARKCPVCGKETIIKGKQEYGGGWLCFAKKGGCGEKWADGAVEIEGQSVERVEHDNPADFYNTVLKMAKKRAFVDATITATAASDIFTQDIGDGEGNGEGDDVPKRPTETPTPSQGQSVLPTVKTPPSASVTPAKAIPANSPKPNPAAIEAWLNMHKAKLIAQLAPNRDAALDYGRAAGILLPGDDLEDGSIAAWFPGIDWGRPIADNEPAVAVAKQRHLEGVAAMMDGERIPDASAPPRKIVLPAEKPVITACPHCNHVGLKPDGEYVGMTICQFCGWRFDEAGKCWEAHPWQYVLCPVPPKGASKKEYDKHPITLGQMERTDNKRAFGMVMNFTAEPREWQGKVYQPSAADIKFAQACEQARAHLQKPKAQTQAEQPDDPEVPF